MTNGIESELKFVFSRQSLPTIKTAVRGETGGSSEREHLISHYFDTADDYLWRHRTTLRVRHNGRDNIQTVKREKPSALNRDEYECGTDGDTPDLSAVNKTPLARLFKKRKVRDHLERSIDVDVTRETSTIELDGARIEVALDVGDITSHGETATINELELELKSGQTAALFELARCLCADAPICLSFISKAERGHLLAKRAWGRAFKSNSAAIDRRLNCADAFRLICHACLHDFALNMQALEGNDRIEALHQGRVSLRKLRAALRLFKPIVHDAHCQHLDDELRWISHVFGEARDLDVFQESVLEPAARDGDNPGARELADLTRAKRDQAHEEVNNGINSERMRILLVDLVAWMEHGRWCREERTEWRQSIDTFARQALRKRLRKFIRQAGDLAERDAAAQHKIRIKAKKLRYMAGFFKSAPQLVAKPKALQSLLTCLEEMQNCLGEIHDQRAISEFLLAEVRSLPAGANAMIGYAAGRLAQTQTDTGNKLSKAVDASRTLEEMNPF